MAVRPSLEKIAVTWRSTARSERKRRAAIQKALVTGAVIQAGEQRRDGVQIDPGRYSVLLRAPSEDTDPTDTVSLEVR